MKLKYFVGSKKYGKIAENIQQFVACGMLAKAKSLFSELPSEKQLMSEMAEKLKSKPVGKTLKKIAAGQVLSIAENIKCWSSFMAHVAIEVESGGEEYKVLLPTIHHRLGVLIGEC